MANIATNSKRTRMVRVLHLVFPSRATAVGEAIVALVVVIAGVPLSVHLILAIIVDLAVHLARRHGSPRSLPAGRLK